MVIDLSSNWDHHMLHNEYGVEPEKLTVGLAKYRTNRTGNRQTRTTQIDHDVFEGLPVRHWRKKPVNVNTAPEKEITKTTTMLRSGYQELPLPRDFSMLPENSQVLLRAARMGLPKGASTNDDDKENEDDEIAKGDDETTLVAHRWALIPRDVEGPEPEYLAKRRKGLPSVYTGIMAPVGAGQMRRTKIRKVDSQGNNSIWEVLVPEGQTVDGETVEDEATPTLPPAPGTVVEGLGVVNHEGIVIAGEQALPAPTRRRPPIPKKKKHGPGRGRKKKIEPAPAQMGAVATKGFIVNGVDAAEQSGAPDGIQEREKREQMDGDDSTMQDLQQYDEEGSEEGSEGEEGEDGDREEGELSPSLGAVGSSTAPAPSSVDDITPNAGHIPSSTRSSEQAMLLTTASVPENTMQHVNTEVDSQEPAMVTPMMTVNAGIVKSNNDVAANTKVNSVEEVATVPKSEEDLAVETSIDIHTAPALHAFVDKEATLALPIEDEILPSETPNTPKAPSSSTQAATEDATGIKASPPSQEIPMSEDPIDTFEHTQQLTSMGAELSAQPLPPSASIVETPLTLPTQSPQDMNSPPPIPQTLSQFPEPPTTLPARPPTPPPQRRQQPPPSLPADNHRRPSGSTPKAPTPSPPTPIETSFDHPTQNMSPRAPTMSPPTPLDRDSSPETALADQQRNPPPVPLTSYHRTTFPPIPGLYLMPEEDKINVEAAPRIDDPHYNAEIPHQHDPLSGLTAPEIPPDQRKLGSETQKRATAPIPPQDERLDVEAAPHVDEPSFDAEIPHDHNPLDGLAPPEMPPHERKLDAPGANGKDGHIVKFEDGREDLLGTLEKNLF